MFCMICVHIYVTICLAPLIYGCVEQMHGCVEQMHKYQIIYIMMGMDVLDGYWMENMLVLMVFWMGLGGFGMVFG